MEQLKQERAIPRDSAFLRELFLGSSLFRLSSNFKTNLFKIFKKKYHHMKLLTFLLLASVSLLSCSMKQEKAPAGRWSKEKAWEWYNKYDWLVGTNFNPSTAINQLEFW